MIKSQKTLCGQHTAFRDSRLLTGTLLASAAFLSGCVTDDSARSPSTALLVYPVTRKTNMVDDYHGVKVADAYRWLDERDIPQTITVIPASVIQQQGATSLTDVLRNVPGLTTPRPDPSGQESHSARCCRVHRAFWEDKHEGRQSIPPGAGPGPFA